MQFALTVISLDIAACFCTMKTDLLLFIAVPPVGLAEL